MCVIIIRSVFEEDSKYYPQILLHDCFYEHEEDMNPPVVQSAHLFICEFISIFF